MTEYTSLAVYLFQTYWIQKTKLPLDWITYTYESEMLNENHAIFAITSIFRLILNEDFNNNQFQWPHEECTEFSFFLFE